MLRFFTAILPALLLGACTGLPDSVQPVQGFDTKRYLGKWYEIARLDHSFERGLSHVTADYSLRDDGGIRVINRGYSKQKNVWKQAEGKAYFVGRQKTAHLKVSFFGPFYGSYAVFELDHKNYQYAFISGYNNSYLWLLSRKPNVDKTLLKRFINKSKALGFDTDKLIIVDQKAASKILNKED